MVQKVLSSLLLILMSGFACCVQDTTTRVERGEVYYSSEPPEHAPKSRWRHRESLFEKQGPMVNLDSPYNLTKIDLFYPLIIDACHQIKTRYPLYMCHRYSYDRLALSSRSDPKAEIVFEDENGPMEIHSEKYCFCVLGSKITLFITLEKILELLTTTDNAKFNELLVEYHLITPTVRDGVVTFRVAATDDYHLESIPLPLTSIGL